MDLAKIKVSEILNISLTELDQITFENDEIKSYLGCFVDGPTQNLSTHDLISEHTFNKYVNLLIKWPDSQSFCKNQVSFNFFIFLVN